VKRSIINNLIYWNKSKNRKPLILKGARQVGKTYILRQFGESDFDNYHYLNFEMDEALSLIFEKDLNPTRIINEISLYLNTAINPDTDLLILDEIQACPRALNSLKYFEENLKGLAVCAAGSLLGIQLGEGAYPVGKVDYLDMFPMSFEEFLTACEENQLIDVIQTCGPQNPIPEIAHTRLWDYFKTYLIVGGLPEVVQLFIDQKKDLFTALQAVRKKQADLVRDYMADIAKHSGKQNAMHIERIWKNIPAQLAREQDGSASKFRFKGVVPGISSYTRMTGAFDWLCSAGLVLKASIVNSGQLPFSAYTKENCFKLFCFDTGILGAMSQITPKTILDYDYGTYKGYFAENFIAQEFRCAGIQNLFSWREKKAEVEFLIEKNGEVLPVEVKSGWVTQAKSLKVFAEKYSPPFRTIMSARNLNIDNTNHVHHLPLYLAGRFPLVM